MKIPRTIKINGVVYCRAALQERLDFVLSQPETEEWEKNIYRFLKEWIDDSPYVYARTSGSTGKPKTIRLEKSKMLASAELTNCYFKLTENSKALLCLSAEYIAGKMMLVRAMQAGFDIHVVKPASTPMFSTPVVFDFAAVVPMQMQSILDQPNGRRWLDCHIKSLIIGGGAVAPTLEQRLRSLLVQCYATYGMTETVSHVALRSINGRKASQWYEAMPGIRFSVDERDCLIIHAPHLHDAPLITNDVVTLDSETRFAWLGRFDHVINSGGIKLFPETIERKLSGLIHVRFFLAAQPDDLLGEKCVLVIESSAWDEDAKTRLQEDMKNCLDKYEMPREIIFIPRFKETPTGKIVRKW